MQYDFNLPANGGQQLDVKGRFFKYKSGRGPIRVRTSNGGYVDLLPGQGASGLDFSSLTISDKSGAVNAGVLLAGDFDFRDDRISGTVDVVDGGRSRTLGGTVFSAARGPGGTAGQCNHTQLWNPVGSGKRVVVAQITAGASAQDVIAIGIYNTMLGTLLGNGINKLSSGAQSTAETRSALNPAVLMQSMNNLPVPAWTALMNKYTEPVVIMPGNGMCIANNTQGIALYTTFEFYEELI